MRPPIIIQRLLGGLALGIGFLFMASVFAPDFTQAVSTPRPAAIEFGGVPSSDPHEGLLHIGSIEDDRYELRIFASEHGPMYSVFDRDGTALRVLMTAEQVAEHFPELPVPSMDYGTEQPLTSAIADLSRIDD